MNSEFYDAYQKLTEVYNEFVNECIKNKTENDYEYYYFSYIEIDGAEAIEFDGIHVVNSENLCYPDEICEDYQNKENYNKRVDFIVSEVIRELINRFKLINEISKRLNNIKE